MSVPALIDRRLPVVFIAIDGILLCSSEACAAGVNEQLWYP
jgi:hypothetical protein